jgi:MarR family transcriptional regulator for hemolysin
MGPPAGRPIGLTLARTAKVVSRAFDERLAAAGGSQPVWLVLLALRTGSGGTQTTLAEAVGIRGATLTHHLDGMEGDGLVARHRDPANRRVQIVELTPAGEAMFDRLREAAVAHDRRLRRGLDTDDVARLTELLARMHANVTDESGRATPSAADDGRVGP